MIPVKVLCYTEIFVSPIWNPKGKRWPKVTGLKINTFKLIHVAKTQDNWVPGNLESKTKVFIYNHYVVLKGNV